jgi:hypothetical protein
MNGNSSGGGAPVRLPHDGPAYCDFEQQQQQQNQREGADRDGAAAVSVLVPFRGDDPLLTGLQRAPNLHDQLKLLRQHKQQKRPLQHQPPLAVREEDDQTGRRRRYRILLEWMLSVDTPVPLRRAIGSHLSYLESSSTTTTTSTGSSRYEDVHREVLASVLVGGHSTMMPPPSQWHNPVHSFHEAMNYYYSSRVMSELVLSFEERIVQFLNDQALQNDLRDGAAVDRAVLLAAAIEKAILLLQQQQQHQHPGSVNNDSDIVVAQVQSSGNALNGAESLSSFLWRVLQHPDLPSDNLSAVGIAIGRTLQYRAQGGSHRPELALYTEALAQAGSTLSELQQTGVLQGLAAVVDPSASLPLLLQCFRASKALADQGDPGPAEPSEWVEGRQLLLYCLAAPRPRRGRRQQQQ